MPTEQKQITDQDVLDAYFEKSNVNPVEDESLKFRITGLISFCDNDSKVITALGYRYIIRRSGANLTLLIYLND